MPRLALVLLLACAPLAAAPVPKVAPDPLPDGAVARLGGYRYRGPRTEWVVFSKDGKTLLAPFQNVVHRWDADTGKPLEPIKLDVQGTVRMARVWGDRAFLIIGERKPTTREDQMAPHTVRVFDLPNGKEVSTFEVAGGFYGNDPLQVQHRTASADGKRFAAVPGEGTTLSVYDADTGKVVAEVKGLGDGVSNAVASPDGTRVCAVGYKGATVYDTDTGKAVCSTAAVIGGVAWSPDGKTLAGGVQVQVAVDGKREWRPVLTAVDAATGQERRALPLPGQPRHLAFCGNDAVLVAHATADYTAPRPGLALTRWNLTTGKADWTVPAAFQMGGHDQPIGWLAVSPDGKRCVLSDRVQAMAVYDTATGKRADDATAHPEAVRWVGFSADGGTITTASHRDLRTWDAATGELKTAVAPPEAARGDFAGATPDLFVWSLPNADKSKAEVLAWDRAKGKVAWRAGCGVDETIRVATAGERVVTAGGKPGMGVQTYTVFDRAGKKVADWGVPKGYLQTGGAGTFTADAVYVPTGAPGGFGKRALTKLAVDTGEALTAFDAATLEADPVGVSPSADGKTLLFWLAKWKYAVADADGKVRSRGVIDAFPNGFAGADLSADGSKVLVRSGWDGSPCRVMELKEKGKVWTLDAKGAEVSAAAFSPDGKRAVIGYLDGTALVWDVSK